MKKLIAFVLMLLCLFLGFIFIYQSVFKKADTTICFAVDEPVILTDDKDTYVLENGFSFMSAEYDVNLYFPERLFADSKLIIDFSFLEELYDVKGFYCVSTSELKGNFEFTGYDILNSLPTYLFKDTDKKIEFNGCNFLHIIRLILIKKEFIGTNEDFMNKIDDCTLVVSTIFIDEFFPGLDVGFDTTVNNYFVVPVVSNNGVLLTKSKLMELTKGVKI